MEESIISNLKIKALIIMLITMLIFTGSAFLSKVNAAEEGTEPQVSAQKSNQDIEIKLNRTVKFTGNTYKSYKENAKVKKEYKEETMGLITVIKKSQTHNIYLLGKGWISEDQIVSTKKYIDVTFDLKDGLNTGIKIDGEFIDVDIKNTGVVKLEDGQIKAGVNGTTEVILTKKDGTEVKLLAETHNGNITLKMDEAPVTAEFKDEAIIAEKIVVKTEGNGQIAVKAEGDSISIGAEGNGNMKVETVDGKEIASGDITFSGEAVANLNDLSLEVSGNSRQEVKLLSDKIKIALEEKASGKIDTEGVTVGASGKAEALDTELGEVEGEVSYKYGEENPTGRIAGSVLGSEKIEKSGTIPVISTIKALVSRLPLRAK